MTRAFVVVGETVSVMADVDDRFVEIDETGRDAALRRPVGAARRPYLSIYGTERILRKNMFDVGDEKLLMLLLVMNSKAQDRLDFVKQIFIGARDELVDLLINRGAIFSRFIYSRT